MSHKGILIGALDRVGHMQPEFVRIDPICSDVARRAVLGEKLPKLFQRRPYKARKFTTPTPKKWAGRIQYDRPEGHTPSHGVRADSKAHSERFTRTHGLRHGPKMILNQTKPHTGHLAYAKDSAKWTTRWEGWRVLYSHISVTRDLTLRSDASISPAAARRSKRSIVGPNRSNAVETSRISPSCMRASIWWRKIF